MSTVRLLCAQLPTFQSQPKCPNLSQVQIPMGKNLSQEIFTVYFKWLLVRFHQNVELAIGYKSTPRRYSPPHPCLAFLSNQSSKHLFFKIIIIITVFTYIWAPPHRHDTKVPGTPPKKGMAVVNVTMTRVKMITNMKAVKMRTPTSPWDGGVRSQGRNARCPATPTTYSVSSAESFGW